jgi:SAM-dependent methyltransferase
MPDQSWADGYVVDVEYTHGFYRELTPALLRFVTILGGVQAADTDKAFTYFELGCGQGYTTALLAAANPHGRFYGVDFNPTHILGARELARDAGLGNVEFLEKSFAELLDADLPEAEVIGLHGVWSWINVENRRHIVEFVRRKLKPGGILYLSYNALPGIAPVNPLQRLLHDHASRDSGPLPQRVARAFDFARRLDEAGATYFQHNPVAKLRLGHFGRQDPNYLAHEYFNDNWTAFYHADVARDLVQAKLSFTGSASIAENFEQFNLKPALAKIVASAPDRSVAETIKDFALNKMFRKDVFTRGAPRGTQGELVAILGRTRFALAKPRATCSLNAAMPAGEISLQAEAYAPVLDALARAPMTFEELANAPEAAALDRSRLRQAVFGMAELGNILPGLPAAGEADRRRSTDGFNRAVLSRPASPSSTTMLASPVLGSGIPLNFADRAILTAPAGRDGIFDHVWNTLVASGWKPLKDGKPLETTAEAHAMVEERIRFWSEVLHPYLRQVGIVD